MKNPVMGCLMTSKKLLLGSSVMTLAVEVEKTERQDRERL